MAKYGKVLSWRRFLTAQSRFAISV